MSFLTRRKPIDAAVPSEAHRLKKTLGWPHLIAFGVGAGAPLVAIGFASRQALARQRARLIAGGKGAKIALGALLIVLGVMIVSGLDRRLETVLVDWSPLWLTNLTTRF